MSNYILNILIAVDQLVNVIFSGSPDETISARAYRSAVIKAAPKLRWRIALILINALFLDRHHCHTAYISELKRSQYPNDYQNKILRN